MPYALYADAVPVSGSFPSKSDVWRHAEQSGLVTEVGLGEEDPPRRILDMGYTIRECGTADAVAPSGIGVTSDNGISGAFVACQINPPFLASAS